jgi:hypothetical protein
MEEKGQGAEGEKDDSVCRSWRDVTTCAAAPGDVAATMMFLTMEGLQAVRTVDANGMDADLRSCLPLPALQQRAEQGEHGGRARHNLGQMRSSGDCSRPNSHADVAGGVHDYFSNAAAEGAGMVGDGEEGQRVKPLRPHVLVAV